MLTTYTFYDMNGVNSLTIISLSIYKFVSFSTIFHNPSSIINSTRVLPIVMQSVSSVFPFRFVSFIAFVCISCTSSLIRVKNQSGPYSTLYPVLTIPSEESRPLIRLYSFRPLRGGMVGGPYGPLLVQY